MAEQPKKGEFCWNELATADVKKAKEFYGKVFGWEFSEHPMEDATYTMIRQNNKDIAGIWAIPKGQEKHIPPHWMAYILVENVEDILNKASKQGATIVKAVTQAGDFGHLAIIQDPTGAHIALWQPIKK
jgi:predicted enzyme related to lactoylglutathione lyase